MLDFDDQAEQERAQANSWLILSLRHLGDAVVASGFVNALTLRYPEIAVDVLGRDDLRTITLELCTVRNYISIDIPVFGHHRKNLPAVAAALQTVVRLRKRKYDCCVNLMGDFRENTIARLLGAREVMSPVWAHGHPFRRHIRAIGSTDSLGHGSELLRGNTSYYHAIQSFATQMGLGELCWPTFERQRGQPGSPPVIGVHPGASHISKLWPVSKWKLLMRRLGEMHVPMRLYGSPSEAIGLAENFRSEIEELGIDLITGGISGFLQSLRTLDLLICVDSFSCHAAHAVGIPTVVLFGPFDPAAMTPPTGVSFSAGAQCARFPCYRGRSCKNAASPYVCVRGIAVDTIMAAVDMKIASLERTVTNEPIEKQIYTAHE